MAAVKQWFLLNLTLGAIAVILLFNFFGITLPSAGKVAYFLDTEAPLCLVHWKGEFTLWNDLDRCCLEARQQLSCTKETKELSLGRVDHVCKTGSSTASYLLNNKAYRYCQQQAFW